jgi:hypothetical protein
MTIKKPQHYFILKYGATEIDMPVLELKVIPIKKYDEDSKFNQF